MDQMSVVVVSSHAPGSVVALGQHNCLLGVEPDEVTRFDRTVFVGVPVDDHVVLALVAPILAFLNQHDRQVCKS